jgi:biopolymer transport protein ExbB/TolQ/biopolymer transport protein ExbD
METPLVSMIMRAGLEARIVLVILLIFSLITWAVVFNRIVFLRHAVSSNRKYRKFFDNCKSVGDLDRADTAALSSPMACVGKLGIREFKRIQSDATLPGAVRDISFFLQNQFSIAAEHIESSISKTIPTLDKGVFLLAIVSSLSPFLGLLGTVWGIMNSFYEIGNQGSASLPVVAPGIAEALVVTLAGLAVAIPALFFYNYFMHRTERIESELDEFKEVLVEPVYTRSTTGGAPVSRHRRRQLINDLNLTNLIDVMLVLLITFMITAPLMTQGVQVDLPKAEAKNVEVNVSIQVSISNRNEIYIDQERVSLVDFRRRFRDVFAMRTEVPVFVNADKKVPYGLVVRVIADIQSAGVVKLGFLTQPQDNIGSY